MVSDALGLQSNVEPLKFKIPPVIAKDDGSPRMVGFELEFSGLTLDQTVDAIQSSLGGDLQAKNEAEQVLYVESLGEFNVELDWDYLKRKAAEAKKHEEGGEWIDQLSKAAALLVPVEVVCPPIPITNLKVLDSMVAALRDAGAEGTKESFLAAYGVHINAEIPSLDSATLFSYLRAFVILQWWLVKAHEVNITRKISPYIDLYPEVYLKLVLSKSKPTMNELFSDYLEYNASRNRALDLLPILSEIDEKRVRRIIDDPKIKARPAFHYRLPNCNIEHQDWSLALSWNNWWVVEELSQRPDKLDELSTVFLESDQPIIGIRRNKWVEFIDQWLRNHGLV
ncbi:MAG: hypothetical protein AVO38_12160 [delta proteobacterium ML8_D]|jgi:hypothetical protein|nr:MAG: hypothetical protein AVO38_12160 [delta proteobacterium ML8_D]